VYFWIGMTFHGVVEQLAILVVGLGAGALYGLFGAGGAAFATPVLALVGVPATFAIAAPLPSMLPTAFAGARGHLKAGSLDRRIAGLAVAGGVPGTLLGGLASGLVSGHWLLVLSGVMLLVVGARVLLPDPAGHADRCVERHASSSLIVAMAFSVGILTGLLANGGGFLLVPAFIIVFGLSTAAAAGTSLVVAGALSIPTLLVHWQLGHVDWKIALLFGLGSLPGTLLGLRIGKHVPTETARRAFGVLLVVFSVAFLAR
jgi:uncharacterized membrane protein YfcA